MLVCTVCMLKLFVVKHEWMSIWIYMLLNVYYGKLDNRYHALMFINQAVIIFFIMVIVIAQGLDSYKLINACMLICSLPNDIGS